MKAHLLTIGDELLIGQTTNTNAAWLGERLSRLGVRVERIVVVGDDPDHMQAELGRAVEEGELVILTGGLGPTHDDVTREVLADYFDAPLQTDTDVLDRIRFYYERRGRQMPSGAQKLAEVPTGFETIENPVGVAVGLWFDPPGDGSLVAVLPGIPEEMKGIFEASIEPRLDAHPDLRDVTHRTLVTSGIAESSLQERLSGLPDQLGDDVRLAYLPSTRGVRLRLTAASGEGSNPETRLDQLDTWIRERVGEHVLGRGDVTLEEVLGDHLRRAKKTLACAESATGGLIGHRLTSVSGASDYFLGSVVAYANAVKMAQLGVQERTLRDEGAVSEAVAVQMARGGRDALDADIGVSTTGIAGPTGGTPEKPVGTVWIGYADDTGVRAVRRQFVEDRGLNKDLFASAALEVVRREIDEKSEEEST